MSKPGQVEVRLLFFSVLSGTLSYRYTKVPVCVDILVLPPMAYVSVNMTYPAVFYVCTGQVTCFMCGKGRTTLLLSDRLVSHRICLTRILSEIESRLHLNKTNEPREEYITNVFLFIDAEK